MIRRLGGGGGGRAGAVAAGAADAHATAEAGAAWVSVARRAVASYRDHADAERAVGHLARMHFPAERMSVVGLNPRLGEKVTGRLSSGVAAGRAAVTGAVVGALTGWALVAFDLVDSLVGGPWLALNGAIVGAALGALLGLLGRAATRGRRRFIPVGCFTADSFQVMVDAEAADEAARLLLPEPDVTHGPASGSPGTAGTAGTGTAAS